MSPYQCAGASYIILHGTIALIKRIELPEHNLHLSNITLTSNTCSARLSDHMSLRCILQPPLHHQQGHPQLPESRFTLEVQAIWWRRQQQQHSYSLLFISFWCMFDVKCNVYYSVTCMAFNSMLLFPCKYYPSNLSWRCSFRFLTNSCEQLRLHSK